MPLDENTASLACIDHYQRQAWIYDGQPPEQEGRREGPYTGPETR